MPGWRNSKQTSKQRRPIATSERVIEFGSGAHVALYRYDGKEVVILAVRHGSDAGY
jgi:plasmid stabilization system protein ParE